jgi:sulfate-transporting ATPase
MNHLSKVVPPKRALLKDISLSFFPGAKIGVLGLNGSGKSTLLKIMAGVDKTFEGEAMPMPGLKIGFLTQEPVLDAEKTVRQAVEEGLGEVLTAQQQLEAVYTAYADPDADFDALAGEQARLEAPCRPLSPAHQPSGHAPPRRAHQPPGRRVGRLAGTVPGPFSGYRGRRDP